MFLFDRHISYRFCSHIDVSCIFIYRLFVENLIFIFFYTNFATNKRQSNLNRQIGGTLHTDIIICKHNIHLKKTQNYKH